MDRQATRDEGTVAMSKVESLVNIREFWNDRSLTLYKRVRQISEEYYSSNLKLDSTAAYIGATPSELDSLLALSELDDDLLHRVSDANPPITTWMILANASEDELSAAIKELEEVRSQRRSERLESVEERLYSAMIQVSGPTPEQLLSTLSCDVIFAMANRAEAFKVLTDKNLKALKSFGMWRKRGKTLTEKQVKYMKSILTQMVDVGVIVRGGIDKDQEMCDSVLDALGM